MHVKLQFLWDHHRKAVPFAWILWTQTKHPTVINSSWYLIFQLLRVQIWHLAGLVPPSFWGWPKSNTFFKPPMGKDQFGILFGSHLIGIPEIPWVAQKYHIWDFLDFENSNLDCAKMVWFASKSDLQGAADNMDRC